MIRRIKGLRKQDLKEALFRATGGCALQHDGWPCGTCFFSISDDFEALDNSDWQAVLWYRGDYELSDLDNFPEDVTASLHKVYEIATRGIVCV